MVNEGKHYEDIANEFSVTKKTVSNWAKKNGVVIKKKSNRTVFFKLDYFKKIDTEEKAYILGFVSADGYICMQGKTLNITLADKDIYMLEMIAEKLNFTGNIRQEVRDRSTISFCSKEMVNDLSKYGVVQNKTKTSFIPNIPEDLIRHFLRGYFDGDGYVGERQAVLVVASEVFENQLIDYIKSNDLGTPALAKASTNSNKLTFSRKDTEFLKHIYEDSNIYMPRKKESYKRNWRPYWKQKEVHDKELVR